MGKTFKKTSIFLSIVMIISVVLSISAISAFAADEITNDEICVKEKLDTDIPPVDPLKDFIPPSNDFLCDETPVTRSATITVKITSPCDQSWRSTYEKKALYYNRYSNCYNFDYRITFVF